MDSPIRLFAMTYFVLEVTDYFFVGFCESICDMLRYDVCMCRYTYMYIHTYCSKITPRAHTDLFW